MIVIHRYCVYQQIDVGRVGCLVERLNLFIMCDSGCDLEFFFMKITSCVHCFPLES